MKVQCNACKKVYNIPDERLPVEKKISFSCPSCKNKIEIDLRSKSKPQPPPRQSKTSGREWQEVSDPSVSLVKKDMKGKVLMEKIMQTVEDLPPMPNVVMKSQEVLADPNSSVKDLSSILEMDQSIVSKVLKLANSAYYGLSGRVSSIHHASSLLGQKILGEIITMAGVSGFLANAMEGYQQEAGELWRHSIATGICSRIIADKRKPEISNEAYMAGLLHDVGKIILDPYVLERRKEFDDFLEDEEHIFLDAEKEILGFDHTEIASEVCKKWNIPKPIIFAIRYHHSPSLSQGNELSYLTHAADYIAIMSGIGYGDDTLLNEMEEDVMDFLNLTQEEISGILLEVIESVEKVTQEF